MGSSVHEWPAGVEVRGHGSSDTCPCGPTLKSERAWSGLPVYVHRDLTKGTGNVND